MRHVDEKISNLGEGDRSPLGYPQGIDLLAKLIAYQEYPKGI
jgi:hypothetical protein